MVGAIVCKAATRYARNRAGSFSPSSSDSQAVGRSIKATHSLTSVVFPKPAGAEMRVSLRCRPSFSRSIRRGRLTTFGRGRGIYSFVARMGVDIQLLKPPFSAINSSALLGGAVLFPSDDDIALFEQINAFNNR